MPKEETNIKLVHHIVFQQFLVSRNITLGAAICHKGVSSTACAPRFLVVTTTCEGEVMTLVSTFDYCHVPPYLCVCTIN